MDGQWRGYAPEGVLQKGTGSLPELIVSRTVEIDREEAEVLLVDWEARARAARQEVSQTAQPQAAAAATPEGPPAVDPGSPPRASRSRRMLHVLIALVVVFVAAAVGVLAVTGHLGSGASVTTITGSAGSEGGTSMSYAPSDVMATVGGQDIDRERLDQKIADFEAQYPDQVPNAQSAPDQYKAFEEGVLDYLVTYEIVSLEAAALGITVTDQDVESEMALILDSTFGGDQTEFEAAVEESGLTMEQFERIYGESLLFNKVYAEVTGSVTVASGDSAELEAAKRQFWSDWLAQEKQRLAVTYAEGWGEPLTPTIPVT